MPSFYTSSQGFQHPYNAAAPEYHHGHHHPSHTQQRQSHYTSLPFHSQPAIHDYSDASGYSGYGNPAAAQNLGSLQPDPFVQYKCSSGPPPPPTVYNPHSVFGHDAQATALSHSVGAPMLPPLRIDNRFTLDAAHHRDSRYSRNGSSRRHAAHANTGATSTTSSNSNSIGSHLNNNSQVTAKEEKAIGGVSAKLDYQMEQMIDFVAEMTVGMYDLLLSRIHLADIDLIRSVKPGSQYPPTFRKWVSQVLNATRLPSATILLSLSYLTIRVRDLSRSGRFQPSDRCLYQLLTVALILGSKFLDDNTFQNKSWAEVSNIAVSELNQDEREWLKSFGHRLHHDPHQADGYSSWEETWNSFKARPALVQSSTVLHPIDTNLRSQRSFHNNSLSPSYYPRQSSSQQTSTKSLHHGRTLEIEIPETVPLPQPYSSQQHSPYHSWFNSQLPAIEKSPSTAPHTGPTTPDYYSHNIWSPRDHYGNGNNSSRVNSTGPHHQHQHQHQHQQYGYSDMDSHYNSHVATLHSGYLAPSFNYAANSGGVWNSHGAFCQCSACRHSHDMQPRFGPIVVG